MKKYLTPGQYKQTKRIFDSYRSKEATKNEIAPLVVELIIESVDNKPARSEIFHEFRNVMGYKMHDELDVIISKKLKMMNKL